MLLCSRNPGSGVGVGSSPVRPQSARVPLGAASAGTFADCAALRDSGGGALQLLLIQEGDSHKCSLDGGRSARVRAVFCIAERRVTHAVSPVSRARAKKGFPRSGPRGCFLAGPSVRTLFSWLMKLAFLLRRHAGQHAVFTPPDRVDSAAHSAR